MWGHPSTTHNSPRGQVMAQIVPLYVVLAWLFNQLNFYDMTLIEMIYFILNSIKMIYFDLFDIVMMQSDLIK